MIISLLFLFSVDVFADDMDKLEGEFSDFSQLGNYSFANWTTCEQFLANYTFDRTKLLDVDWQIFYYWSLLLEESYTIRFSVPSPTLVDRFSVELDDDIAPPVNWTYADLFMETSVDFSALYIRTNTSGLFKLVSSLAFEFTHVPVAMFGLKYVEPYLGIMNCQQQICYALAPADKMPAPDQIHMEAKKLGFQGEFSRSYLDVTSPPTNLPLPDRAEPDDDDEDEHFEIDKDPESKLYL